MGWNDDIKKIIELMPKIDAIYDEVGKQKTPESDKKIKEMEKGLNELLVKNLELDERVSNLKADQEKRIDELLVKIKKLDDLYKKRLDSALKTYTEISNNGN